MGTPVPLLLTQLTVRAIYAVLWIKFPNLCHAVLATRKEKLSTAQNKRLPVGFKNSAKKRDVLDFMQLTWARRTEPGLAICSWRPGGGAALP